MSRRSPIRRSQGFSLLEVLVTLLIVSLGLLGLSKMQAAGLSNTQISRVRSLIAFQAGSLAAAMHGNRAFWADGGAPATITFSGNIITDASGTLTGSRDCAANVCTPVQLATYDLQQWATATNKAFPSYAATITCSTVGTPVSCVIKMSWAEKYVAINRTAAASGAVQEDPAQQFSLFIEP